MKSITLVGHLLTIALAFSISNCNNHNFKETEPTLVESDDPLIVDYSKATLEVHEQVFNIVKNNTYKKKIIVNMYRKDQYGNESLGGHYEFIINNYIWNEMQKYQSYGRWIGYCFGSYNDKPNGGYPYEYKFIER
jgi:hypothetical protein